MATDKQIAANRLNAQKSTGPKSDEGKARSRQNAFKHGLTGKGIALPTEEAQQVDSRIAAWIDDLKPQGEAQGWLVQHAALASWRLDRCVLHETAQLSYKVRHAAPDMQIAQNLKVLAIAARLDDDPAATVAELQTTVAGCEWLVQRWLELYGLLRDEGYWHYHDKFRAIRLLGKQLDCFLEDITVNDMMVACHKVHPEPWDLQDEAIQAMDAVGKHGVYQMRVQKMRTRIPETREKAMAMLSSVSRYELKRLGELQAKLKAEQEHADVTEAGLRAMFNDAPSGEKLRRYEVSIERQLHQALGALIKLRKSEPGPELEDIEIDSGTVPEPAAPKASKTGSNADRELEPKVEGFVQVSGSELPSNEVVEGVDRPGSGT